MAIFSSRAFLPAFVTALALRYGDMMPYIKNIDMVQHAADAPTWFTNNWTILALGLLAVVEITADKMPEARQVMEGVDTYSKTVLAGLTYLGVVNSTDVRFIEETISQAGFTDYFVTTAVAAGTWFAATLRNSVMGNLREADEDDDTGIQSVISWAEDLWATLGILALLIFPIAMILLNAIAIGALFLLQKYMQYRDDKTKIPCTHCEEQVYRSAMACQNCGTKVEHPAKIGWLGQSKKEPATNLEAHPYRLVMKKRCHVCATRLKKRAINQSCEACNAKAFPDQEFARKYANRIAARVPGVCGIAFLFSLIPVIGLIPGVIYYRLRLVAPFRQYIPLSRRLFLKIVISILFFLLIGLQWIPGIGGFVVPVMALISYGAYSSQFRSMSKID